MTAVQTDRPRPRGAARAGAARRGGVKLHFIVLRLPDFSFRPLSAFDAPGIQNARCDGVLPGYDSGGFSHQTATEFIQIYATA